MFVANPVWLIVCSSNAGGATGQCANCAQPWWKDKAKTGGAQSESATGGAGRRSNGGREYDAAMIGAVREGRHGCRACASHGWVQARLLVPFSSVCAPRLLLPAPVLVPPEPCSRSSRPLSRPSRLLAVRRPRLSRASASPTPKPPDE